MEDNATAQKPARPWLKPLIVVVTLAIAAGAMYLAVRKIDWNEMFSTLASGNLGLLALAVGILSLSCVVRGLRWRVLLSAEKLLPLSTVFWATMSGYLGNAYLPARAGEALRSVLIGEKGGISKMFTLATALTERIMDAVLLVTISAVGLSTLPNIGPEMRQGIKSMAVVGVVGLAGVLVAPRMSGIIQRIIQRLPGPAGAREKLGGITARFLTGAGALQHWGRLGLFLLYSAGIWSLDTLTGLTVARALGLSLTPVQVLLLLAAVGIASAVPSTPGYIGVYQLVAVTVLVPFGLSEAQAVAYILAYQGVNYVVITLWGLPGLWKLRGGLRI